MDLGGIFYIKIKLNTIKGMDKMEMLPSKEKDMRKVFTMEEAIKADKDG